VGLHFHDLRREFASRLLETPGVSLHDVSDWIGHTSVVTTSRYLASSSARKQHVLERFQSSQAAFVVGDEPTPKLVGDTASAR
jgi:integrase